LPQLGLEHTSSIGELSNCLRWRELNLAEVIIFYCPNLFTAIFNCVNFCLYWSERERWI
jgi:hypothetical protein